MIFKLKTLASAIGRVTDVASNDKTKPGVLFDIKDDSVQIYYSNANSIGFQIAEMLKVGPADSDADVVLEEGDIRGRIVFNYDVLTRTIDACKPTGKIITKQVRFEFKENNIVEVHADRILAYTVGDETVYKTVSNVSQAMSWVKSDASMRTAALERGKPGLMYHVDDESYDNYKNELISSGMTEDDIDDTMLPILDRDWFDTRDEWDTKELKELMAKLAVENGKLAYLASKTRKGFQQTSDYVVDIPVNNVDGAGEPMRFNISFTQSTAVISSVSSILGKLEEAYPIIYVHKVEPDTIVFTTDDNAVAFSFKNAKQDRSDIVKVTNCTIMDFTRLMLNFNKEALLSCFESAGKTNDKVAPQFSLVKSEDATMLNMSVKNTGSSASNVYNSVAEYAVDVDGLVGSITFSASLDLFKNAVKRITDDYVAIDACQSSDGIMLRVAGIDLNKWAATAKTHNIEKWTPELNQEYRKEYLGCTTYFRVSV